MDYLGEGDFDTVYALCMERDTIGLTCSSTPTGKRGTFYNMCVNRDMNYVEHYHPSHDNPELILLRIQHHCLRQALAFVDNIVA